MANAKRASMREGPLAALFRKTEDSEGPARRRRGAGERRARREPASETSGRPPPAHPATAACHTPR